MTKENHSENDNIGLLGFILAVTLGCLVMGWYWILFISFIIVSFITLFCIVVTNSVRAETKNIILNDTYQTNLNIDVRARIQERHRLAKQNRK